jgi:hypothetical protein
MVQNVFLLWRLVPPPSALHHLLHFLTRLTGAMNSSFHSPPLLTLKVDADGDRDGEGVAAEQLLHYHRIRTRNFGKEN